ncbi:transmembrane protein, putative (macronuclear) [Tetrahymena thermophila SB210]|uniref:Transmembrane protein, putative n=1 Tax=Tetrahymena thermophila (strain SB210) TaxID=312017 RepID=W7XBX3_TETTS|nr:transmembrane protein, putative [Tetrahymena thermophila SB210]EWS76870.1 transmembrane protein, putative [Tetrahymena thermophila SB210]|eukprot:XP_012650594.1 transmembrane protein, putative [Tetrahymena thermophila SB210]
MCLLKDSIKDRQSVFIFTNSQQYVCFLYSEYSKPYDSLTEQQLRILTFFFSTIIPIKGIIIAHIKNKGKNKINIQEQYSIVQHFKVTSAVRYQIPPISLQDII